jgi:esterase/lipase superfamily enzyme
MSTIFRIQNMSVVFLIGLAAFPVVGAARDKDDPLMPTPVMFSEEHIDPFLHLAPVFKTAESKVFYATNRKSKSKGGKAKYGKGIDDIMSVGTGTVRFGEEGTTWAEIDEASKAPDPRANPIPMYLTGASEIAQFAEGQSVGDDATLTAEQQEFVDAINAELKVVADDKILVYVHGARFTFETALTQTAEVNHFAGRDMVGVAYAWPTHKDIIAYGFGVDVQRANHSGPILADLIELLAAHTDAKEIHLLSWSAGGRIAGRALVNLRRKYTDLTSEQLREKFRLKLVMFAAADIPLDTFIAGLTSVHDMTDRLTVLQSDGDSTLEFGAKMMRGGQRVGLYTGDMTDEEVTRILDPVPRVEIIDVSAFKEERGFDITGHHYWYENPWISTDVLINIRLGLAPADRGLTATGKPRRWGFKSDYPERIGEVLDKVGAQTGDLRDRAQ